MPEEKGKGPAPAKEPAKFAMLPKIINGGIAGIIGVTCVFPLDTVKTRLQNQKPGPDGKLMYKNIIDCFKKTYAQEGYFGMYRGSAINIILITPEKAIKLTFNDMFRYYLTKKDGTLPILRQMLAGGMAGACQIVVTTPMELLKIQMQDSGPAKANGKPIKRLSLIELITQLFKERGFFGLYKGLGATAVRDVTFSIIYFPLFAISNEAGPRKPNTNDIPFWWSFVAGLSSASFGAWIVTPLDVIKTRLQAADSGRYKGIQGAILKTFNEEGFKGLFKGGLCRVMVLAPLFGIAQAVYLLGVAEYLFGL